MFRWMLAALAILWAAPAVASETLAYAGPSPWVREQGFASAGPDDSSDAARIVLQDLQLRYGDAGHETFTHTVLELRTTQALALGNLSLNWDPATEEVTVHHVRLHRAGQVIDVLARGQSFTILRREARLEQSMLDGRLTAVLQVEGVQVGDLIDVSYTLKHNDPVMQGRSEMLINLNRGKVGRLFLRQTWSNSQPLRWQASGLLAEPRLVKSGDMTELVLDLQDVDTPMAAPKGAPARFGSPGRLVVTEFERWAEIAGIMAPMYRQASALAADSPIRAEAARIAAKSSDPAVRAGLALQLVQDQVRYVYLGMNLGGYTPASAELTWSRRFGDCKGKSALLVALLRELGVEADVAFVSTVFGDGLDAQLPLIEVFDHAIVRVRIDGKIYWLDGTRRGDRDIGRITPPPYRWALAVREGATLEPIETPPPPIPLRETNVWIDASAGIDAPALIRGELVLRGNDAAVVGLGLQALSDEKRTEALKSLWAELPWPTEPVTVDWTFVESTGDVRMTMTGASQLEWSGEVGARPRRFQLADMTVGWRQEFEREPGPDADAPFAVESPVFTTVRLEIKLPRAGAGFRFTGGDVEQVVAGFELKRAMRLEGGVFTGIASQRSLVSEIPFAEKEAAEQGLNALSSGIFLEAPRGYKRSVEEMEIEAGRTSTAYFEYSFRATTLFELGRVDEAIRVLDTAVARDTERPDAYNIRCWTLAKANRDLQKALADCSKALAFEPDSANFLDSRALVRFRLGQFDKAIADYDRALERVPELAASLYMRGIAKRRLGRIEDGDDDIATAIALDKDVAEQFTKVGIEP